MCLHEIIHDSKVKKKDGLVLKLDFEKAYDSISWDFVEEILCRKDFGDKLRNWIMSIVRGGAGFVSTSMVKMAAISKLTEV